MDKNDAPTISRITASGALEKIKNFHQSNCRHFKEDVVSGDREKIRVIASKRAPHATKELVSAINQTLIALKLPYVLESDVVCNIKQHDGNLRLNLKFVPERDSEAKKILAEIGEIEKIRDANLVALDQWFADGLYKIASREPVTEMFTLDPEAGVMPR